MRQTLLYYNGAFTQDLVVTFSEVLSQKLGNSKLVYSLVDIFIEMSQNLMHYSKDKSGSIVVIKGEDGYLIESCNTINSTQKERIISRIDAIKPMSRDELKLYYKECRKYGKFTHLQGGGLGFVQIQRHASAPLEYSFEDLSNGETIFKLTTTLQGA